jgi:hypothetical protein
MSHLCRRMQWIVDDLARVDQMDVHVYRVGVIPDALPVT